MHVANEHDDWMEDDPVGDVLTSVLAIAVPAAMVWLVTSNIWAAVALTGGEMRMPLGIAHDCTARLRGLPTVLATGAAATQGDLRVAWRRPEPLDGCTEFYGSQDSSGCDDEICCIGLLHDANDRLIRATRSRSVEAGDQDTSNGSTSSYANGLMP